MTCAGVMATTKEMSGRLSACLIGICFPPPRARRWDIGTASRVARGAFRSGRNLRVLQVGLDPPIAHVNVGGIQAPGADIVELVRDVRGAEDNLSSLSLDPGLPNGEEGA